MARARLHTRRRWSAVYLVLSGLPNFYFHVTTAYNILRHCGVELGKRDFLGSTPKQ
jgi:hypothetical protein